MEYDSTPPIFYDDPQTTYDSSSGGPPGRKARMDYVALKLNEKSLEDKKTLATNLAAALVTNVATYATPAPATTVLTGKVSAITAKQTQIAAAQAVVDGYTADLAALELDLDTELTAEAAYIQLTSGGVAAKITLLGLELKGHGSTVTAPGQVLDLKLSAGANAGEVKSVCKPVTGAVSYIYQWTLDPTHPETWALKDTSSGCRTTLTGFISGSHVWIRMQAVGGKKTGKGPWSDPASITVP
jgi:hypothetical protein